MTQETLVAPPETSQETIAGYYSTDAHRRLYQLEHDNLLGVFPELPRRSVEPVTSRAEQELSRFERRSSIDFDPVIDDANLRRDILVNGNEWFPSGLLLFMYETLADASVVGTEPQNEELYGQITPERIGSDLVRLARGYRLAHMDGSLTTYRFMNEDGKRPPVKREPVPVVEEDVDYLVQATHEEKVASLSEMLDPYRYPSSQATPEELTDAQSQEQEMSLRILESMAPSWERDLLAIEAVRTFTHQNIMRPDLADAAIGLISRVEFQEAVKASVELASQRTPEVIMEEVKQGSPRALEKLLEGKTEADKARLKAEAEEHSDNFRVVVNTSWAALNGILRESNRVLTMAEVHRTSSGSTGALADRQPAEARWGFVARDDAISHRPIYGTLALSDGERAIGGEGAQGYGNVLITIKPEVEDSRVVFTYGDSLRTSSRGAPEELQASRMALSEARVAKLLYDDENAGSRGDGRLLRYVEAQILGGIEVDDIESISFVITGYTPADSRYMRMLQEDCPGVKIRMIISRTDYKELSEKAKAAIARDEYELVVDDGMLESRGGLALYPKRHQ